MAGEILHCPKCEAILDFIPQMGILQCSVCETRFILKEATGAEVLGAILKQNVKSVKDIPALLHK